MYRLITKAIAICFASTMATPACAAFTVYSDQASFLAAAGTISTETFNNVSADIAASSAGAAIADFTVNGNAMVDAPSTSIDINGTGNLYLNISYGGWADLIFNQPITAFGMQMNNSRLQLLSINIDRIGPSTGEYHHIASYAAPDPYVSDQSFNGFLGFTSDVAFNRIVFSGTGCCASTFAVDDVVYATTLTNPVPEPLTHSLLGSGLVSLLILNRKKRGNSATPKACHRR